MRICNSNRDFYFKIFCSSILFQYICKDKVTLGRMDQLHGRMYVELRDLKRKKNIKSKLMVTFLPYYWTPNYKQDLTHVGSFFFGCV